jgi:hypothetical protein
MPTGIMGCQHGADQVTELDEAITDVLAQRGKEVMGPSAGADDSLKGGRKQANKKGLAPLENTVTEGLITAAEAKRRARREKEEEEAQEERIQTAIRVLHCLRQNSTCPLLPLTAAGRAVKYSRKHALDKVNGGLLVALVRGDSTPDADTFAVFVELDLVISTPIQRSRHSFGIGRLFMPADFPEEYQQTNPREMRDVTLSEVAHLALGEAVSEHLKRQNRAFLASVGGLTFQKDELRTMTWADFGFRINCEPIRTQLISTWVTLPGDVAENYLNEEKVDFKVVAEAVRIWKDAGEIHRINAHTHERNVAGLDALRKTYHDLKKAARKEGVSFQSWTRPHSQGNFLPNESTAPGPGEDAEDASESEDSGDDDQMPEPVSPITAPSPKRRTGTRTKQDCQMRAGVARVIKGPEDKPTEEREAPISPGRRAGRIGKKVIVSGEESEEVPLQLNRGKGRPEKAGKPLPFTAMLGLENPKTCSDCDPGLEAEMRLLGVLEEEEDQQQWDDLPPNADGPEAPFSLGLGAQGTRSEDKLHALLQEKVEMEKEKESPAKGEGSGKEIQWPEGLAQREATLAEVTTGGNIVNP